MPDNGVRSCLWLPSSLILMWRERNTSMRGLVSKTNIALGKTHISNNLIIIFLPLNQVCPQAFPYKFSYKYIFQKIERYWMAVKEVFKTDSKTFAADNVESATLSRSRTWATEQKVVLITTCWLLSSLLKKYAWFYWSAKAPKGSIERHLNADEKKYSDKRNDYVLLKNCCVNYHVKQSRIHQPRSQGSFHQEVLRTRLRVHVKTQKILETSLFTLQYILNLIFDLIYQTPDEVVDNKKDNNRTIEEV